MPPRKKKAGSSDEDDVIEVEDSDSDFVVDDDSEEEKPKKRKAPAKKAPAKKPAAKKKAAASDDEDDFIDSEEDEKPAKKKAPARKPAAKKKAAASDDDEDEKPAKKRAPAKKPAPKKKAESDDGEDGDEDDGPKKKKAKPTPAKPKVVNKKFTEPEVLEDGFTAHPPSLLYKQFGDAVSSAKIAAFDLDGTLILSRSGNDFTEDEHDWYTYNKKVVDKLKQYHEDGYKVVVFSNQGGIKSALGGATSIKVRGKITNFLKTVPVPVLVLLATNLNDDWRKPETEMWSFMCSDLNGGAQPDLSQCFFVGDDFNGADVGFAENVGIEYRTEKAEFGEPDPRPTPQVEEGVNGPLVAAFLTLVQQANEEVKQGNDKARFKAIAFKKVAEALKSFPKKITDDPKIFKEVCALPGVGKGSQAIIKDFLRDGCLKPKEAIPENRIGTAVGNTKDREEAMQFM